MISILNRILLVRGGAIGDFILTLPALKALRDSCPRPQIEILGNEHIAVLAESRFYAQAVRSIEFGALSSFFARNSKLSNELVSYFASFDLIISYLYDPDGVFEENLRHCGVKNLIRGPAKIDGGSHAARQLALPIEELGARVEDFAARLYPSSEDRHAAVKVLSDLARPIVAFHPGSGSEIKNWPLENWIEIGNRLLASTDFSGSIVIVFGEADKRQATRLGSIWQSLRVRLVENLPLPHLAAVLEGTIFIGHDSGISHLAAAAGANCILIFGPTDPAIWAPLNENVCVLHAPDRDLHRLPVDVVCDALGQALIRIGIRT